MLDNIITLQVDETHTSTPVETVYTRVDFLNNRSIYESEDHTLVERDILGFYRSTPTKSGNFNGTAKSAFKLTSDQSVPGVDTTTTLVAPLIGEVSFSIPIGTDAAEVLKLRQRMVALLNDDDILDALNTLQV
jgi:hypothetical protein